MSAIAATAADRLDRVLAQLDGIQPKGHYYEAHCPNVARHKRDDRKRSLSITPMPDGGIRLKCFTGCTHEQIVAAAGIDRADLRGDGQSPGFQLVRVPVERPRTTPAPKSSNPPPPRRVRRVGLADYPVKDVDGTLVATKRREDWRLADGTIDKACWWEPKLSALGLAVEDVPLYGSEKLGTLPAGAQVVVCEGEKAAQALLDAGIAAVGTVTGASATPSPASLSVLAGYDVVLWPDYDAAGRDHMTAIASRLAELDIAARWFAWRDAGSKADAADYLLANAGDGCGLPILRALLHNAPTWAPSESSGDTQSFSPTEVARKAALLDEIERFLHSHLDMTASDQLVTIEAGIALNKRERLGDRDAFYLPDAGIAARTGITRTTVARTRVSVWQRAGIASHTAPPPADLVGTVKDYDGTHVALPAGVAPAGARLIATCRVNIPAKPEHKAKGVPRRVALRELLPETIEPCDVCPPETPVRVQIVCTGCGQLCYDQAHICGDTRQTMHKVSALVKTDGETLPGQKTMHKVSTWFENAGRVAQRRHALAALDPVLPLRDGLVIPAPVAPVEPMGSSGPPVAHEACMICGAPATDTTGHNPPLRVCRDCLLSPIPTDANGVPLIVGVATYSAEHRSAADD